MNSLFRIARTFLLWTGITVSVFGLPGDDRRYQLVPRTTSLSGKTPLPTVSSVSHSTTAASTTIVVITVSGTSRCGAAHGTRTVCAPSNTCHSVSTGYSTCAKSTIATQPTSTAKSVTTTSVTSKASTSVATSPVPTASGSSGIVNAKKGLSYNSPSLTKPFGKTISWAYNWAQESNGNYGEDADTLNAGIEFVPMLWSDASSLTGIWAANVKAAIAGGATHLLGFNEPDNAGQADMTVAQAVTAWKQYMEPYHTQIKLVSPAITNGGAPGGVAWLQDFITACTGCHIDAIAMHWYDSATNFGYFYNYFSDAATTFSKPIWITEFQGSGTAAQQVTFINTVVPWMDKQPFIERYAIFGDFEGAASSGDMITNGALNAVGTAYNNAA